MAAAVVAVVLGAAIATSLLPTSAQEIVFHTPLTILVLILGTGWQLWRIARRGPGAPDGPPTPSGPSLVRRTSSKPGFHRGVLVTSCTTAKTSSTGRSITVTTSNSFICLPQAALRLLRPSPPSSHRQSRVSKGAATRGARRASPTTCGN